MFNRAVFRSQQNLQLWGGGRKRVGNTLRPYIHCRNLFIYLIYLFLRNATFNICKVQQYNQNLSGAIRQNSVLITTPLEEEK